MVAGRLGLDHHGVAPGVEARQQDRRLHLGRRLGQAVDGPLEAPAAQGQGQAAAGAVQESGAHLGQGLHHPVHGATTERGVASEGGGEVEAGGGAQNEPDPGPSVPTVDDVVRLGKAAAAGDPPASVPQRLHPGAEGAHGRRRAQDVLSLQQTLDLGDAPGEGAEDQGAVGDRLVTGRADASTQRTSPPGAQSGRLAS